MFLNDRFRPSKSLHFCSKYTGYSKNNICGLMEVPSTLKSYVFVEETMDIIGNSISQILPSMVTDSCYTCCL